MAYALKPVIDTWLKLSTAQGSTLPEDQKQLIDAGTVLPVSAFELIGNDHIKVTLGRDAQGQQIQFKDRNTWYVYRPAVQLLRDGQVVALPNQPQPTSVYLLKPLTDIWLKLSTAQGSTLPDDQRQFIRDGEPLPLESYAAAPNNHLKVTLGRNADGKPIQFKGRNTWYVYRPSVQITTASPAPTPAPTPAPVSPYSIRITIDTWLKQSTAQGSGLPDNQRQLINSDTVIPIASYQSAPDDHLRIVLGRDTQGNQIQFKGRNTWFVYRPSVQVLNNGQPVPVPAPTPAPTPSGRHQINAKGLRLLKSFEGLELRAYQDAVGVWTIGYGTTSGVRPGMMITQAQAEELLKRDLDRFERAVIDLVRVPLNDDQFSALVSFVYNIGEGALATSTLLRLLNQRDYQGAADQLLRWDKAGGQTLAGLTRRRRAERALFLGQDYTVFL